MSSHLNAVGFGRSLLAVFGLLDRKVVELVIEFSGGSQAKIRYKEIGEDNLEHTRRFTRFAPGQFIESLKEALGIRSDIYTTRIVITLHNSNLVEVESVQIPNPDLQELDWTQLRS